MSTLVHDLKIAGRTITTKPSFSLMVIGMLALGIAGNAAIFSIFNGLFLRPLPFAQPDRLVDLDETAPKWNLKYVGVSNPDFYAWRKQNTTFDAMSFFDGSSFNLSGLGQAQRIQGARVTHDMVNVLKLKLELGRNFLPEEDKPGGAKVALIGFDLWHRLFNADRNILGRILKLDNQPYAIVGVLPREAVFPPRADLWVPLAANPEEGNGWYLDGIGRLKQGVSLDRARANLTSIHVALKNDITSPIVTPLRDRYLGDFRPVTHVLLAAVGIVLLIACVNIAALMMVRAAARAREIAIRTAIGASRSQIVRQLLTESLLLAAVGGALGMLLGAVCLKGMIALMPDDMPRWISFSLDARFAVFCVLITGAAAVLFGLAPAVQAAGVDPRASLQDAGLRSSLSRARRGVLSGLVVCEIALALMLLISAGLLVQAFRKVLHVDPGFRPENVITYRIALPDAKYTKHEQRVVFFQNLLERLRAMPGLESAGAATAPPLGGHWVNFFRAQDGRELGPKEQDPVVLVVAVTPRYFDAIGITFLAGRPFDERDGQSKDAPAAIVNQSFIKQYWPQLRNTNDVIGKKIRYSWQKDKWINVVGVTRDEKHYGLEQEMRPSVYIPFRQADGVTSLSIVLRGSVDPRGLVAPAREILRQMDPDLPMFEVRTMTETLDRSLWARRAYSWLFGAFSAVALVLAAAGIYGVVSYAVSQRTHEIGIRMALGARPGQVLRQVLASGMLLLGIGMVVGLTGTLWAARLLNTLLFGVSSTDPFIYAIVILGVAFMALLANLVPARRAAAVEPMRALRFE
jgi:putative ABC transport system permease protein